MAGAMGVGVGLGVGVGARVGLGVCVGLGVGEGVAVGVGVGVGVTPGVGLGAGVGVGVEVGDGVGVGVGTGVGVGLGVGVGTLVGVGVGVTPGEGVTLGVGVGLGLGVGIGLGVGLGIVVGVGVVVCARAGDAIRVASTPAPTARSGNARRNGSRRLVINSYPMAGSQGLTGHFPRGVRYVKKWRGPPPLVARHGQAAYSRPPIPIPVPFTSQTFPWLVTGALAVALVWVTVWAQRRYRRISDAFRAHRRSVAGVGQMLNRIRHAVESASDAIGIGDMQGISLYHNRAHVALFGYSVEELNAIDENMVLFADRTVAAAIHASIRAGYSWVGETEIRTKDGRTVPCLVRADIIRDDEGRPAGIFGVFTDVTERRRIQKLLDQKAEEAARVNRLESMGMLAGGIAHDFGNLIMAMVGSIELMKMEPDLPDRAKGRLASLEKTVWRANDVTKQLVDFAKGSEPRMEPIGLESPLRESASYAVVGSSVELGFSIAPNLRKVAGDEGQLVQVFNNISINAVQAMPGGGRLTVAAENSSTGPNGETSSAGGEWVHVSITDTGTGIAPENLGKIFDPFFTTKDKGTGFGLSTCYTIVKKHHGQLSVESEPGRGTTFHIMLPAHPSLT